MDLRLTCSVAWGHGLRHQLNAYQIRCVSGDDYLGLANECSPGARSVTDMRIVHTADLHLAEDAVKRWEALREIIDTCRREDARVLTISGDLFNSDADAEALRPRVRDFFTDNSFDTLIIPGNHDAHSYTSGLYFGERVHLLSQPDWSENVREFGNVQIMGIPYEDIDLLTFQEKLRDLAHVLDPEKATCVLYHGELVDASYDRGGFGPQENRRYMPSRLAFFQDLGPNYVLAGHFHTHFDIRSWTEDGYFVYPGSPVSITRRETGRRKVAFVEVGAAPIERALTTHYYQRIEVVLNALEEKDPVQVIAEALATASTEATVLFSTRGTILGSEAELVEAINAKIEGLDVEAEFQFRGVANVIQHPVFEFFNQRLDAALENDADPKERNAELMRSLLIRAMTDAQL